MSKIRKEDRYKTCVARYSSTSELLPQTIDASCGGLQARIKAGKNYILPVFVVNSILEKYAHQHMEVRGEGLVDNRMRAYETKRVRPVVDFEVLPEEIDANETERYEKVLAFMAKLKDTKSEEYREHICGGTAVPDRESLYADLQLPITQLNYSSIKPQPDSHFQKENEYSYSRNPRQFEPTKPDATVVNKLSTENQELKDKIASQDEKLEKMMRLVEATIANNTPKKGKKKEEDDGSKTIVET